MNFIVKKNKVVIVPCSKRSLSKKYSTFGDNDSVDEESFDYGDNVIKGS